MSRYTSYDNASIIMAIKQAGPFAYYITLPLLKPQGRSPLSLPESVEALNFVISRLNRKLFGANGKKRGEHITGYCCIEDHEHGGYHFHALIRKEPKMFAKSEPNFSKLFYESAERLHRKNPIKGHYRTYNIASREHLSCEFIKRNAPVNKQEIFDPRVHDHARYVTKEIRKPLEYRGRLYERWYFIEEGGISLTTRS